MTARTHIPVGIGITAITATLIPTLRPDNLVDLGISLALTTIGSVIPDIDIKGTTKLRKLIAIGVLVWLISTFDYSQENIIKSVSLAFYLGVVLIAARSRHKTFTHQLIGAIILTVPLVTLFTPRQIAWYLGGILSHQMLDLLNTTEIKWLYPLKKDYALYLFNEDNKKIKRLITITGILTSLVFVSLIATKLGVLDIKIPPLQPHIDNVVDWYKNTFTVKDIQ